MRLRRDQGMASRDDKINGKSLAMSYRPWALSAGSRRGPKTTMMPQFDFHGRNGNGSLIPFWLRRGLSCGASVFHCSVIALHATSKLTKGFAIRFLVRCLMTAWLSFE